MRGAERTGWGEPCCLQGSFFFFFPEVIQDNPLLMTTRRREHWFDSRPAVGLPPVVLLSL